MSSTPSPSDSVVVRFLDSFLQERNIKWVLAAGMLILLGSSLMMVMPHWDDFGPVARFATLFTYTAAVWTAGWTSYRKLGLRKTGHALLALTVVLLPLSCSAWRWLGASNDGWIGGVSAIVALSLAGVATLAIGRSTFRHFLRGDQPTFLASYVFLSLAGGIAPVLRGADPMWIGFAALGLWGIASAGIVKVNRHVFWLTESLQQPRILGFFPVFLLGGQFLGIFVFYFAASLTVDWIGFACVLVAIPVLLTADAVARVFQERTGDLVRPWPWSIMLPLTAGLVLCSAGIILALLRFSTAVPYALVPTALLVSVLMGVVARRTRHSAFVWASLAALTLAYNFSPIFFQGLARFLLEQGAAAVRERRLPLAFYGLTYLPLILGTALAAGWARQRPDGLFARPLRQFTVGLCLCLWVLSLSHAKAALPVSVVMTGMFGWLTRAFDDRRMALAAGLTYVAATAGMVPLLVAVEGTRWTPEAYYLVPAVGALSLLAASRWIDGVLRRLPVQGHWWAGEAQRPCLSASRAATLVLAAVWFLRPVYLAAAPGWLPAVCLAALLLVHSLLQPRIVRCWITYGFVFVELFRGLVQQDASPADCLGVATWLGLAQWGLAHGLSFRPDHASARLWERVHRQASSFGLAFATIFVAVPDVAHAISAQPLTWLEAARSSLVLLWWFDLARRWQSAPAPWCTTGRAVATLVGCGGLLGMAGMWLVAIGGPGAASWVPVAWSVVVLLAVPVVERLDARLRRMDSSTVLADEYEAARLITRVVERATRWSGLILATVPLFYFPWPWRWAGGVALVSLALTGIRRRESTTLFGVAALFNGYVLLAGWQASIPLASNLFGLMVPHAGRGPSIGAAIGAISLCVWQWAATRVPGKLRSPAAAFRAWLHVAVAGSLVATLGSESPDILSILLAALAFGLMVSRELGVACSQRQEAHVWMAEGILASAVVYFAWLGVLGSELALLLYGTLVAGLVLYVAGSLAGRWPVTSVLSRPFLRTGNVLPLVTVVFGVGRHLADRSPESWLGANSLALLVAGAFYFWRAIEQRRKEYALLAGGVLNVAIALMWRELAFRDPQFYMIPWGISVLVLVQVLKREIPAVWHNPLRYAGALIILVSPTFHIVGGSWLHLFSLMIAATCVLLLSIGLRVRALMYTGTAFLIADLAGMVLCGASDHPHVLWLAGIGVGGSVIALGAYCEHHRERLLQRMRLLSARLEHWE